MSPFITRRTFTKRSLLASASALALPSLLSSAARPPSAALAPNRITSLAESLLLQWCRGLYANQIDRPADPAVHGGLYSPGDGAVLGRCADAIVPFLWMAAHTGEARYVEAAKRVYAWEQVNASSEDGAWFNNPGKPSGWKAITVFGAITKLEALSAYPDLLGEETVAQWRARLRQAAEYIYRTFHIDLANINYPATATYALFQLGRMFNEDKYLVKAAELAEGMRAFFTPEGLLWGEGGRSLNAHGQYPVDLGYNVEESLQALALYSRLAGDAELETLVVRSLRVHLEFMLPNGGWDNSWGTRNFKWTLWGSRTSDGCHPGYYLLADEDPAFAEAVYRNLQCLEASTHDNLLMSGPHEHLAGVRPSIHHTFEHAKALTKLLHTPAPVRTRVDQPVRLPREQASGIQRFDSIRTLLLAKGPWRGTVTGYNYIYKEKFFDGHCSGGALSCLYHMGFGMVSAASMTEYQRWEAQNMLPEAAVKNFMCLTPRLELAVPGMPLYRNISDHEAHLEVEESGDALRLHTAARLVTGRQEPPPAGAPVATMTYELTPTALSLSLRLDRAVEDPATLTFWFPVVCSSEETVSVQRHRVELRSARGSLSIDSSHPIQTPLPATERGYNFIPGLQVFPLQIDGSRLHEEACVLRFLGSPAA
jgi:hypothetical protein